MSEYIWAVSRPDISPTAKLRFDEKGDRAREWHQSILGEAKWVFPDQPEMWPKLLRAKVEWEEVNDAQTDERPDRG